MKKLITFLFIFFFISNLKNIKPANTLNENLNISNKNQIKKLIINEFYNSLNKEQQKIYLSYLKNNKENFNENNLDKIIDLNKKILNDPKAIPGFNLNDPFLEIIITYNNNNEIVYF